MSSYEWKHFILISAFVSGLLTTFGNVLSEKKSELLLPKTPSSAPPLCASFLTHLFQVLSALCQSNSCLLLSILPKQHFLVFKGDFE